MNEEKTTTWQWRQGYDYATAKYKAELDRLRADNAELSNDISRCAEELDRLRARNEELEKFIIGVADRKEENGRLRDELERLKSDRFANESSQDSKGGEMSDIVAALRAERMSGTGECYGCYDRERELAAQEIDRLRAAAIPVCIGRNMISTLAKEGAWTADNRSCVIAADDLHGNDPYAELDRLRAENAELREALTYIGNLDPGCEYQAIRIVELALAKIKEMK